MASDGVLARMASAMSTVGSMVVDACPLPAFWWSGMVLLGQEKLAKTETPEHQPAWENA